MTTETAAERYRRLAREHAATDEVFDLETPSGMVWKVRKPDLAQFIVSGVMPISLAEKVATLQTSAGNEAAAFAQLSTKEQIRIIDFKNRVVRFCAVEPRIVENPESGDEIGFDEVMMADYNAIFEWAMPGGGEAETLSKFRRKRK